MGEFLETIRQKTDEINGKKRKIDTLLAELCKRKEQIFHLEKEAIILRRRSNQLDDYTVVCDYFPLVLNYFLKNNFPIYSDIFMISGPPFQNVIVGLLHRTFGRRR